MSGFNGVDGYSEKLKQRMLDNGITQSELAKMLDIHPSAVSRWLSVSRGNIINPNAESVRNIETAIDRILAARLKKRAVAK